jgi:hypothetical protein
MDTSLRKLMIKSAQERINMRKKHNAQKILLEREINKIEGELNVQRRERV